MVEFKIYFSDLNPEAQKRLLEAVGVKEPKGMNWDIDMAPLAIYETEQPISGSEKNGIQ